MDTCTSSRGKVVYYQRVMKGIVCVCALFITAAVALAGLAGEVMADEKPKLEAYGFIRFDIMAGDSPMNNNFVPMWVLNEASDDVIADDAFLIFHPRLTRLGLRFKGFELSDKWTLDGGVEIDFQIFDAGSDSRQVPRMRLGYVRLNRSDFSILAGQHWDPISTLYPNVNLNGVNWNVGNTGDRRPQLRFTYQPEVGDGTISLTACLAQFGAVNMSDINKDGVPDGQDSSVPMFQGWFGTKQKIGENSSIMAGVWGHYWQENDVVVPVTPSNDAVSDFRSWSIGGDLKVKATEWLLFQGEVWSGENLGDIRGGIGQTVNLTTLKEIRATGGWVEVDVKPTDQITLIAGYTIDDVKNEDIMEGDRAQNQAPYASVRHKPWKSLMLTLEYMHFETTYLGFEKTSVNNFLNFHMMYFF